MLLDQENHAPRANHENRLPDKVQPVQSAPDCLLASVIRHTLIIRSVPSRDRHRVPQGHWRVLRFGS